MAFIPTPFMSGGSAAPMENSPPAIQTMPWGAGPGGVAGLEMVGPNHALADEEPACTAVAVRCEYTDQANTASISTAPIEKRLRLRSRG